MTDPLFDGGDGNTPLDVDEQDGLRPTWIRTRSDLNQAELDNILEGRRQVRVPAEASGVLDDVWLRRLHKRLFGDVWTWAGTYRRTERNIGIEPSRIGVAVRDLVADAALWIEQEPFELAGARFHHRLVAIHPFPNGNGRHARVATDYLGAALNAPTPTWGAGVARPVAELRRAYLAALRAADRDRDDLERLTVFMWS